MASKHQKLELTWIGKDSQPKLEPRILIEDTDKSYGDKDSPNLLIHGDNLLALKALEQEFIGKIKCIFIDPPYNTGSAFTHTRTKEMWPLIFFGGVKMVKTLYLD